MLVTSVFLSQRAWRDLSTARSLRASTTSRRWSRALKKLKIETKSAIADSQKPAYSVRFEPRKVEDLRRSYPREAFERVRQMSEFNEPLYRTFASPWATG